MEDAQLKKKSDGTNQEDLEEMYANQALTEYANQALTESHRKNPVRPPLPKMPSFIATAIIFSFLGHQDYIKELVRRLSHTSRRYYLSHKEIINGFVTEWTETPEVLVLTKAERRGGGRGCTFTTTWLEKCEQELGTPEGEKRVKAFVRIFKRKGGENGGPGDLDALHADLVAIMFSEEPETADELRNFLEADGGWDGCIVTFSASKQEDKLKFMNVLNRIGWIEESDPTVKDD